MHSSYNPTNQFYDGVYSPLLLPNHGASTKCGTRWSYCMIQLCLHHMQLNTSIVVLLRMASFCVPWPCTSGHSGTINAYARLSRAMHDGYVARAPVASATTVACDHVDHAANGVCVTHIAFFVDAATPPTPPWSILRRSRRYFSYYSYYVGSFLLLKCCASYSSPQQHYSSQRMNGWNSCLVHNLYVPCYC
jgi:hypothetical protein